MNAVHHPLALALLFAPISSLGGADQPAKDNAAVKKEVKLPGLLINMEQRSVDIEGAICLREGSLELVACTKGSKEHEAIVAIDAKPMHIHAALLLLGAKPGNPAMRRAIEGKNDRWEDVPPAGGQVDVSLVIEDANKKPVEHPIRDFIISSEEQPGKEGAFPTNTFLFTGSLLVQDGPGPRKYVCDESGNVISLVTFGDEVLGLPEVHGSENNALLWQVNGNKLPPEGTKVILRLRPKAEGGKTNSSNHREQAPSRSPQK